MSKDSRPGIGDGSQWRRRRPGGSDAPNGRPLGEGNTSGNNANSGARNRNGLHAQYMRPSHNGVQPPPEFRVKVLPPSKAAAEHTAPDVTANGSAPERQIEAFKLVHDDQLREPVKVEVKGKDGEIGGIVDRPSVAHDVASRYKGDAKVLTPYTVCFVDVGKPQDGEMLGNSSVVYVAFQNGETTTRVPVADLFDGNTHTEPMRYVTAIGSDQLESMKPLIAEVFTKLISAENNAPTAETSYEELELPIDRLDFVANLPKETNSDKAVASALQARAIYELIVNKEHLKKGTREERDDITVVRIPSDTPDVDSVVGSSNYGVAVAYIKEDGSLSIIRTDQMSMAQECANARPGLTVGMALELVNTYVDEARIVEQSEKLFNRDHGVLEDVEDAIHPDDHVDQRRVNFNGAVVNHVSARNGSSNLSPEAAEILERLPEQDGEGIDEAFDALRALSGGSKRRGA